MSPQPLEPHDPRDLGGYRLIERLGEGGQGIVFLGEDLSDQRVAVKVLKVAASGEARAQLKKEMAAAQRVAQFCTAQVLGGSVDGPQPYVVSEYVEGLSLDERVRTRGRCPAPVSNGWPSSPPPR
jgi:eukaryotic-like serine/threonine-protein kinase